MAGSSDQGDVVFGKHSIATARTRRLLDFYRTAIANTQESLPEGPGDDEFYPTSDTGGMAMRGDEGGGLGTADIVARGSASNDTLLERILGKKAAAVRRKSMQPKSSAAIRDGRTPADAPMAVPRAVAHDEDDDDDDGPGRSNAFSARGVMVGNQPKHHATRAMSSKLEGGNTAVDAGSTASQLADQGTSHRQKKRSTTSYLDEILGKKGKKRRMAQAT